MRSVGDCGSQGSTNLTDENRLLRLLPKRPR